MYMYLSFGLRFSAPVVIDKYRFPTGMSFYEGLSVGTFKVGTSCPPRTEATLLAWWSDVSSPFPGQTFISSIKLIVDHGSVRIYYEHTGVGKYAFTAVKP